jgi:gas vesicle protein
MNRLIIWFRRLAVAFLVGMTFVGLQFGFVVSPAQAETVTPEANSYQTQQNKNGEDLGKKTKNSLKEAVENVREKLNLDEPLDPGTKQVLNSTQRRVEEAVKPITGKEQSTYQQN